MLQAGHDARGVETDRLEIEPTQRSLREGLGEDDFLAED